MLGNIRYCHLINPHTGYPMQAVQAVTILTHGTRAGVMSDAASKPLFMSGVKGWRNAAKLMNVDEAMLIDEQGKVHLTAALKSRLELIDSITPVEVE
jgi:thiamine biosynthesis lipoprotein